MAHWSIDQIAQMAEVKKPSVFFKQMVQRTEKGALGILEMARLHPLGDEYLESIENALLEGVSHSKGWIYLMTDGSALYKIGFTKKEVSSRQKSLSGTAVAGQFHIIHAVHVLDAPQAEVLVKRQLQPFSAAKEFYTIGWRQGIMALDTARLELHNSIRKLNLEALAKELDASDQLCAQFLQQKSQQKLAC